MHVGTLQKQRGAIAGTTTAMSRLMDDGYLSNVRFVSGSLQKNEVFPGLLHRTALLNFVATTTTSSTIDLCLEESLCVQQSNPIHTQDTLNHGVSAQAVSLSFWTSRNEVNHQPERVGIVYACVAAALEDLLCRGFVLNQDGHRRRLEVAAAGGTAVLAMWRYYSVLLTHLRFLNLHSDCLFRLDRL
jgi:hypothetical protein